jgi:ArsR family transcriptional regulator
MEMYEAVEALAALANETRLKVFRLLVEAGVEGMAAGKIGEELEIPPATLSFHLSHLSRAGLVGVRQDGRFLIYSASFQTTGLLVGYLTENCCVRGSCGPAPSKSTSKEHSHEKVSRARRGK